MNHPTVHIRTHRAPDGLPVATVTMPDGRTLRVCGASCVTWVRRGSFSA